MDFVVGRGVPAMVNVWMDDVMTYDIRELSSVVSIKLGIVAVGKIVQPEEKERIRVGW